jgi:hypothetical protein
LKVTRKLHLRHFVNLKSQVKVNQLFYGILSSNSTFYLKLLKRFYRTKFFLLDFKIMKPEQSEK